MIKPQAIALLGFGERSAQMASPAAAQQIVGASLDTQRLSGSMIVLSRIPTISGAGAAAVIIVEDSADGNTWAEAGRFPSRAAVVDTPPDVIAVGRVGRYVRVKLELVGGDAALVRVRNEVIGVLT